MIVHLTKSDKKVGCRRTTVVLTTALCALTALSACGNNTPTTAPSDNVAHYEMANHHQVAPNAQADHHCAAALAALPRWVPATAQLHNQECAENSEAKPKHRTAPGLTNVGGSNAAKFFGYTLSGTQNASTMVPYDQMTDDGIRNGAYHPASGITFVVYPTPGPPDAGVGGPGLNQSVIDLANGHSARLTHGENGFGPVRIEWADSQRSYLLMTVNYKTPDGTSGVPVADLVKMAGSVPTT